VALFLILVARPAAVFLTPSFARLNVREKAMLAWVGLRGATPIILATFPLLAGPQRPAQTGLPKANLIFDLVFFVVTTSVLLKGMSLRRMARLLGVDAPVERKRQYPLEFVRSHSTKTDLMELRIPPDSAAIGRQIVELGLPKGTLVVLIGRGSEFMIPSGSTVLNQGDSMLVLVDRESLQDARRILDVKREA
jgi:cell volume regulation protein A